LHCKGSKYPERAGRALDNQTTAQRQFYWRCHKLFPGQEVYARIVPSFDAFEDEKTYTAFKKTSRKKLVISGLWTSMCFAFTACMGSKTATRSTG